MADITLNSAVRSNLRTLQSTTDLLNRTEERLSTGKKVNGALDNPSSFFTAQALDRRSSDLNSLLDSVSSSVKTLEAADNGIKAITDVVESLKATARSALQSPSAVSSKASVTSTALTGVTADNLLGAAAQVEGTAAYGVAAVAGDAGNLVLNGQTIAVATGDTAAGVVDKINAKRSDTNVTASLNVDGKVVLTAKTGTDITVGATSTAATLTKLGLTATTTEQGGALNGKTLAVTIDGALQPAIAFGNGTNEVSTLDELNSQLSTYGVQASLDGTSLKLTTTNASATSSFTVSGSATGSGNQFVTTASSAPVIGGDGKTTRDNYLKDFNSALSQISTLAKDSSFNGVNLLNGDDLEIAFNEDGSSKLDVKGANFNFEGLGLQSLAAGDEFDSAESINKVIDSLDAAFSKLESQSSKFGSQLQIVQARESFTKDMIGTLEDGALALTGADTNAEAANLATLQTRQSLIVSSLAISTSQEQNVLQLLR